MRVYSPRTGPIASTDGVSSWEHIMSIAKSVMRSSLGNSHTRALGTSALIIGVVVIAPLWLTAQEKADGKPYGIDKRVPWTTSRIKGSPEPPPPYRTVSAFPKLK